MLFFIRNALALALVSLSMGCGALKSSRLPSSQNERQHIMSCGPEAIRNAVYELNLNGHNVQSVSLTEISKELKKKNKCSTITRDVVSLFVYESKRVTFPCEIKKYFTDRGFRVETLKELDELKQGDVAIVLIYRKGTLSYHWITYPASNNIIKFFGKDTVLKRIYLLER